ncbi:MAG: arylsulfatase A-like enzyme, partial [Pseudoalteromonas tetraodonis]
MLKTLAILLLAATSAIAAKPNIVFIMVDDLGFGDLSSHGAKDMRTPNIDQLMADGVRFDKAYANCPVCSPTRASFLTGRYPDMVGVPGVIRTFRKDNWGNLDTQVPTIAETFKKGGYKTALVGKWHLGLEGEATPNQCGFDFFKGWLGDMMDDYYKHRRHGVPYMRENAKEIKPKGHATDLFGEWASLYMLDRIQKQDGPFFLFVSFNAPHTPIQPPDSWLIKVLEREKDNGITEKRAKLVALIEHLDERVGNVVKFAKSPKLGETIIVFTSDNGGQVNVGANNGANRGGKQEMWEGGLRVPTCVVWPGKTKPGTRLDSVTMTMDWLPTLAEAAGIKAPDDLDGTSILPDILGNGKVDPLRPLVWVRREGGMKYGGRAYYAIRKGAWKLLQNTPYEPMQLFDLSKDSMEESAVTNEPAIFNQLSHQLREHINASG